LDEAGYHDRFLDRLRTHAGVQASGDKTTSASAVSMS
jgi:hypothetical protein